MNNIWDRMRKGTQMISEKSGELLEMAKVRAAVSKLETDMVKKYTELGELTYRIYMREQVDDRQIERLCEELKALAFELREYREQLAGMVTSCPACKRPVKPGARYCPECGRELRE